MKKFVILVLLFLSTIFIGYNIPQKSRNNEYLRVHIRANSDLQVDQEVKYEIRSVVVDFLTPKLNNVKSKEDVLEIIRLNILSLKDSIDFTLSSQKRGYKCQVKIDKEYFPTRNYKSLTLESGFYDALIIDLGEGCGDNWWCLVYPPLCFTNDEQNVKFKSKICELWQRLKRG